MRSAGAETLGQGPHVHDDAGGIVARERQHRAAVVVEIAVVVVLPDHDDPLGGRPSLRSARRLPGLEGDGGGVLVLRRDG